MPSITVSATDRGHIPDRRMNGLNATRKSLVVVLMSGDASWGYNSDVDHTTAGVAGIPMTIGEKLGMDSPVFDYSRPIYFYSTAGCVINYQENLQ